MDYKLFVTPGLGDNSYLLISGQEAALIDPQRDAWRFLAVAESQKVRLRYALETHVHNDYVTGALEVRAATGAEVAAPARGKYEFPHRPMAEGDELRVGAVRLVAIETPGHTPEHISWLVYEDGASDPMAVFTGGSLIVGSAGRTDLLGHDVADELTRAQFGSVRRLAALPAQVQLLPTHGAGSFCTASVPSMARTSTIGEELAQNPALAPRDVEAFVRSSSAGFVPIRPTIRTSRRSTGVGLACCGACRGRRRSPPTRWRGGSRPACGWSTRETAAHSPRRTSQDRSTSSSIPRSAPTWGG